MSLHDAIMKDEHGKYNLMSYEDAHYLVTQKNYKTYGYVMKCPFGHYYVCSNVRKQGKNTTALERYNILEGYKREICDLAFYHAKTEGTIYDSAEDLLKSILLAQYELSFYDSNDYIILLENKDDKYEYKEIRNKMQTIRKKIKELRG